MSDTHSSPGDRPNALQTTSFTAFAVAVPISLILFAYERAVIPIYATVPTRLFLTHFTILALILPHVQPFKKMRAISAQWKWFLAGGALALAPNATYWTAIWSARGKNPVYGPMVVHSSVLVPLVSAVANITVSHSNRTLAQSLKNAVASLMAYPVAKSLEKVWSGWPLLSEVTSSQILLCLAVLAFSIGIIQIDFARTSPSAPSKPHKGTKKRVSANSSTPLSPLVKKAALLVCFIAFFSSFYTKFHSPVLSDPLQYPLVQPSTTSDGVEVRILSSVQSTTGLIVVGEATTPPKQHLKKYDESGVVHSMRYLRAAHSLLGGVWFGPRAMTISTDDKPVRDSRGVALGDSIYGAFVLQEAARLVNSTAKVQENALIIGLGTGVAANAFHRHQLNFSVVEIDPAVYDAAIRYFGLPDPGPGNVYLEDARGWAARKRSDVESGVKEEQTLYDIVVHDCFSGGGVPEQLFSMEFWRDLKSVIHPEGVIAVNFAGVVISDAFRLILRTLEMAFGGECRAFFDSVSSVTKQQLEEDFLNVVFFCSPSPTPLTFRPAFLEDLLGSPLRRHVLGTLSQREIDLSSLRDGDEQDKANGLPEVMTDGNNPLGKMQEKQALRHWQLMRDVLPDLFWETY